MTEAQEQEIKKMKRAELNELAAEYGLDPKDYRLVDDLRSAIFDYLKQQEQKQRDEATQETQQEESEVAVEKEEAEEAEDKKKGPAPKVRPHVERKGKKYRKAVEKIDKHTVYELNEAVKLAQETSTTSFDATVEAHIRLNVDPKKADQNIRGSLVLPNGTGKEMRVAVMADEAEQQKAKKAGADIVDSETIINQLKKEDIAFDVLIATPKQMGQLGKFAKFLGPKGLMPNPKSETVTTNVEKAVKDAKAGRVEFRVDRYGIIHSPVGKVSFKTEQLADNIAALAQAIRDARPATIKNEYIVSSSLTTSMGPSVKVKL